jgi:dienelactone hydrolase
MRFASLMTVLVFPGATSARAEWIDLELPTGVKMKATFEKPELVGKAHVVIYLLGRMPRTAGYEAAADRGYNVAAFARAFAYAGFSAIAPLRKTPVIAENEDDAVAEGLATVLAAATRQHNVLRVSVVGIGEGGLMALWALSQMPDLTTGVVLSTSSLTNGNDRATSTNMDTFIQIGAAKWIRAPVLLTVGDRETRTAKRNTTRVSVTLMKAHRRFWYIKNYPEKRRWFHQPRNAYMEDVVAFLKR